MKQGFTLIEMLVASLLLGMLVVILTMVFNSSSIAWRTGKASVAELDKSRRNISLMQREADSAVRLGNQAFRVVSPWKMESGSETVRDRAIDLQGQLSGSAYGLPASALNQFKNPTGGWCGWGQADISQQARADASVSYTVGVRSYGPDGLANTSDDITTWPGAEEDMK